MGSRADMADKFRLFIDNLRIDNPEVISRRCREISQVLNLHYWDINLIRVIYTTWVLMVGKRL